MSGVIKFENMKNSLSLPPKTPCLYKKKSEEFCYFECKSFNYRPAMPFLGRIDGNRCMRPFIIYIYTKMDNNI